MAIHLQEVKIRILYCFSSFLFTLAIALIYWQELLFILVEPLHLPRLIFTNLPEAFLVTLQVSFTFAIWLNIPLVLYHIWLFLSPAMYPSERSQFSIVCILAMLLSNMAVLISYYFLLPSISQYFLGYQIAAADFHLEVEAKITEYFHASNAFFLVNILLLLLPMLLYVIHSFVQFRLLAVARIRPLLYVLVLFTSAIIAPPDILIQVVINLPILILYEFFLLLLLYNKHILTQNKLKNSK